MSEAYKCDRCGEYYDKELHSLTFRRGDWELFQDDVDDKVHVHICVRCRESYQQWWLNP